MLESEYQRQGNGNQQQRNQDAGRRYSHWKNVVEINPKILQNESGWRRSGNVIVPA